jgi:hypothetical protein
MIECVVLHSIAIDWNSILQPVARRRRLNAVLKDAHEAAGERRNG